MGVCFDSEHFLGTRPIRCSNGNRRLPASSYDGGEDLDLPPGYSPRSQRARRKSSQPSSDGSGNEKDAEELGVTGGPRTMKTRETPDRHRRGTGQAPLLRAT